MASKLRWLTIAHQPSAQVIELLENSTWGTPDKSMRYTHCDVSERIKNIEKPHFIQLQKGNNLIGLGCFCEYPVSIARQNTRSFYIRYFNFKESYQIEQVSSLRRSKKQSGIKNELFELLSHEGLSEGQKTVFYAYVDPDNERSLSLCNFFGFRPIRTFTTCLFSRMKPKKSRNVAKYSLAEEETIKGLLQSKYVKYNMFSFRNLFYDGNYFVYKDENGEIIAGVHAHPVHWRIKDMPGTSGKFILNVIPKLPILNKLFSPDYKFVALEGLFVKQGREDALEVLLESILSEFQLTSALLWTDIGSTEYETFKKLPKGIMNAFYSENHVQVIAKTIGFSQKEERSLDTQPSYISSFDMT